MEPLPKWETGFRGKTASKMKKLKLNLKDVGEILTREQLKQVFGGSDGCTRFYCRCSGSVGAWEGTYCSAQAIADAIQTWCASGAGTCNPLG